MKRLAIIFLLALLPAAKPATVWQTVVEAADRTRLAGLWGAWTHALNEARAAGELGTLQALGPLASADGAIKAALPTAGNFRCRSIKIGKRDIGGNASAAPGTMVNIGDATPCRIVLNKGHLWFEQASGRQRIGGTLYPDRDRMVFLGGVALTGENAMIHYGADPDRDQVGVLRAIGPDHWRLELPWPRWQTNLELIEIMPG